MELPTQNFDTQKQNEQITATTPQIYNDHRSFWTSWNFFILLTAGILCSVIIGILVLGALSKDSMPHERLYTFKTNVVEKAVSLTKFDTHNRINYEISLLEQRLTELQTLNSDQGTSTTNTLTKIATLSDRHTHTVMELIEKESNLSVEEKIVTLATLTDIVRAQETLIDASDELDPINDSIQVTKSSANDALKFTIETFATSSAPEVIHAFIATHIQEVSEDSKQIAYGSNAQNLIMRRLTDTSEALIDGEMVDAITYILRAQQAIAVDNFPRKPA